MLKEIETHLEEQLKKIGEYLKIDERIVKKIAKEQKRIFNQELIEEQMQQDQREQMLKKQQTGRSGDSPVKNASRKQMMRSEKVKISKEKKVEIIPEEVLDRKRYLGDIQF